MYLTVPTPQRMCARIDQLCVNAATALPFSPTTFSSVQQQERASKTPAGRTQVIANLLCICSAGGAYMKGEEGLGKCLVFCPINLVESTTAP